MATTTTASKEGKVVKLSISTPSTGPAAEKSLPMGDANLDAIKYINNELSGVDGYQIDPIRRDNGYNAANMESEPGIGTTITVEAPG